MQKLSLWFKGKLPKYLLAAVLIIVPLFPKFPLFSVPGTYVAVRFEDLILLSLAVMVFFGVIKNFKTLIKDEIFLAFLLFFGVNLISLASAIFLTKTVTPHIAILNYLRRVEYLIPFFAIITLFDKKQISDNLNYFVKILLIVTVITFIYGLGQRYLSFPIIITQNDQYSKGVALRWTEGSHISSTFAGHYDLAAFMVMALPIFITLLFSLKDVWDKIFLLVATGGGLWLLINSLSRISQASYLAAVTVAMIMARKFKGLAVALIVSIIFISLSSSLHARFYRIIDVYYQRFFVSKVSEIKRSFVVHAEEQTLPSLRPDNSVPTPTPVPVFEDRSTSIRLKVEWPRALRALSVNPLLGTGYSSIGLATDNDFLRMLGETGILGFTAFFLIFVRIGKLFVKSMFVKHKFSNLELGFVIGMIGAIIGTFMGATFIDIFEASKFATIFWFMVGYSVYLTRTRLNE